jgi:hypothetical protein
MKILMVLASHVVAPKLEMFTKRRLKWTKPLDLPQFENMPN